MNAFDERRRFDRACLWLLSRTPAPLRTRWPLARFFWQPSEIAEAEREALKQECARTVEVVAERDAAIAHDRQPYPTAWAYEQVCKALELAKVGVVETQAKLDAVEQERDAHAWHAFHSGICIGLANPAGGSVDSFRELFEAWQRTWKAKP